MLSTEERAIKNRANAQKSTGPVTPDGKQRSAKNSLKHGQRAQMLKNFVPPHSAVLCNQDRQRYFRLHERMIAKYHPYDTTEAAVVKKIADAEWRAVTFDELFTAFWNKELMDKFEGRQENIPELAELLVELNVYKDQAHHPAVEKMHHRIKRATERTIAANEKRLLLLRRHFPSASTAIERRDFDREKRDFFRSHPELLEWSAEPTNEATVSGPPEEDDGFQLVEQ